MPHGLTVFGCYVGSHSNCTWLVEVLPVQEGLGTHTGNTSWQLHVHTYGAARSGLTSVSEHSCLCDYLTYYFLWSVHDSTWPRHAAIPLLGMKFRRDSWDDKLAFAEATQRQRGWGQVGGWGTFIHSSISVAAVQALLCDA